jgi:broad specificity phosphatase PhoE
MIYLVRHGRTAANARGLLLGRADPELDDEGRRQATALSQLLQTDCAGRATQVVSSPLKRCRQTAETIAAGLGGDVTVDDRWIEMDYGEFDGMPVASVTTETWAHWMGDVAWAPPGGESLADLGTRVRQACRELVGVETETPDKDVIVVTHVSPIKAAVAWTLGVGDEVAWRLFVAPASVTRLNATGSRRSLHSFNETAHLA